MMKKNYTNVLKTLFMVSAISISSIAAAQSSSTQTTTAQNPSGQTSSTPQIPAGETIVALVNDKIITTYDLRQRIRLILLSSGGEIRPDEVPQLEQEALKDLIEERVKGKELEKFEVKTSDKEIDRELVQIANQAGLSLTDLQNALIGQGISIEAWRKQIGTSVGWQNLVQGRFRDRVKINELEVDQTIESIRDDATKVQYLVSELCIPVDDRAQIQAYYQAGLQLIEQLRKGVPFAAAAQQFSGCTSASLGGDIGWVQAGELATELDEALQVLPVGSVTNPIPSEDSLIILALRDKKAPAEPGEISFTLAYASAPLSIGENTARLELQKLATAEICNARAIKLDLGPNVSTALIEGLKISEIKPKFARFIKDLKRGDLSAVIEDGDDLHMVHICEKDEGLGVPPRAAIENRIFGRQLSLLGQRYLREIERRSTIERREDAILTNGTR